MAGRPPDERGQPRTLLEHLLWCQDHTYEELAARYDQLARSLGERSTVTARHLRRLASGERTGANPVTRRVLSAMFGQPIDILLGPYSDSVPDCDPSLTGVATLSERQILAMAARRARNFTLGSGAGLTSEVIEQLHGEVAALTVAYQQQPLSGILSQLIETQDTLFTFLEGRRAPGDARHLYFLAGVASGLLAKVSHDLADPHVALTQSRTAFLCADNADHNGLRAWIRGLQTLISYWAGRYHESIRYAQQGAEYQTLNTASVWLPVAEARAWAALGDADASRAAIQRADDARDRVELDDVDELGGLCTFSRARQLYYAADAMAWLPTQAADAQRFALDALQAYADPTDPEWGFGDAAGAATDLAVARVYLGELEGAADAVRPVLALPPAQRIHGVVSSVNHVHAALTRRPPSPASRDLQERIEDFAATPAAALSR